MKAVLTRVRSASVSIDGELHGSIGQGFLILLGITHEDTEAQAVKLADKLVGLRIFEDEDGKMNRGLETVGGEILVVSQFTLYGNCRKGRRPDFLAAARPEVACVLHAHSVEVATPIVQAYQGERALDGSLRPENLVADVPAYLQTLLDASPQLQTGPKMDTRNAPITYGYSNSNN